MIRARRALSLVAVLVTCLAGNPAPSQAESPSAFFHDLARQSSAGSAQERAHAREIQRRFERLRQRELPRTLGGGSHGCDERIGRLCVWDDGDSDRDFAPEPASIDEARSQLLTSLDSLAALIPGDAWLHGQRVRYRIEAGRLDDAAHVAASCRVAEPWPCAALAGLVEHLRGHTPAATAAFQDALDSMPRDVRIRWLDLDPLLDRELRAWLDDQGDSLVAAQRIWTLADPLFLAPGNDRWNGHMGRWAYAMSSEDTRTPHQLRWGSDLEEVVVRYGWPVAWERSWPQGGGSSSAAVIGRDAPGAVRMFPPVEVLEPGTLDGAVVPWPVVKGHARSAYLPPYLDSMGGLDGQFGRFWRPGGVMVVAAWTPPEFGLPVRSGLFVEQQGILEVQVHSRAPPGVPVRLSARAPWSESAVISLESWFPEDRVAYRLRTGVTMRPLVPGLPALSDIVLLDGGKSPHDLSEIADMIRTDDVVANGDVLSLAFEVYGLDANAAAGTVGFRAWVQRRGESFWARPLRWLRLRGPSEVVSLRWMEAGPSESGPWLRTFRLALPGLDPGPHAALVEVTIPGRTPLLGRKLFWVREP